MRKLLRRGMALGLVAGLVAVPASIPALAQDGSTASITHQQSVLTQLTETGELDTSRVFTQLKVAGDGPVEVVLPNQSTRGLRNLGGLGRPNTDGDSVIYGIDATPSGVSERTVANNTADLPVSMEVEYELDGETLENPRDLVGRSGELKVTYKLRNETVEEQELDIFNARQEPTTETVEVGVPIVGTLSLPLDNRFTDVRADGANIVGDGRGNTIVNWSLVLFEPLGFFEQEVTWTAQVTDAMVPPANAQIAPVSSDSFPSLPNAQSAYADTFAGLQTITDGAVRIDMTLVAILDGAGQLLDGMNQLADGSGELADGLVRAADGSRDLADGTGQASSGSQELASGLGELSDGAGQVAGGTEQVAAGARQLAEGLGGAAAPGAKELADGLSNAAVPGAKQIRDGIRGLLGAVGGAKDDADDGTVLGGLNALIAGLSGDLADGTDALTQLTAGLAAAFGPDADNKTAADKAAEGAAGAGQLAAGIGAIKLQTGELPGVDHLDYSEIKDDLVCVGQREHVLEGVIPIPRDCVSQEVYDALVVLAGQGTLDALNVTVDGSGLMSLDTLLDNLAGGASQIQAGMAAQAESLGTWPATCEAAIDAVSADGADPSGLEVIRASACISVAVDDGLNDLVIPGMEQLRTGMNNPKCDTDRPVETGCGFKQVLELLSGGSGELASGLGDAADGAGALAGGLRDAASGSRDLAGGSGQLAEGAGALAEGANAAATGGRQLSDGLAQIDDGANQLADGLGDARDGSGQLADGMGDARDGGETLIDAMDQLQEFGTNKIRNDVSRAGLQPDRLLKQARAADDRAKAGDGLPYGTADGANASAIYQFEIAGVGSDEGLSTPVRAGAAVLAFGAVGALGLGVRRFLI
jgi:putative membrane protein